MYDTLLNPHLHGVGFMLLLERNTSVYAIYNKAEKSFSVFQKSKFVQCGLEALQLCGILTNAMQMRIFTLYM